MTKKLAVLICVFILLFGCSVVMSKKPVGDKPVVLDPAGWDGVWTTPQGAPVMMKVKDGDKGILRLAWIEDDKDMTFKSYDVIILGSGRWQFANIQDEVKKGEQPKGYLFAKIKKEKDIILIWLPKIEKISELVKKNILPGEAAKESVILGELWPEHMKIIMSEEKDVLFDWESPFFFIKTRE